MRLLCFILIAIVCLLYVSLSLIVILSGCHLLGKGRLLGVLLMPFYLICDLFPFDVWGGTQNSIGSSSLSFHLL